MPLLNRMVQYRPPRIVLLQGTRLLRQQIPYNLRIAATARVDQRCAALRTRLVNIGLTSGDQYLHDFKFAFDRCTIERSQTSMIRCVCLQWLWQVASYGRFHEQGGQLSQAMDATNEKRGLSVLVLHIRFHTAPDQKLHDVFSVRAACDVERGGQLCIDEVWFGACALEKEHEHLCVAELR